MLPQGTPNTGLDSTWYLQAEVVCGIFLTMNRHAFYDDDSVRYTLFVPSLERPDRIEPWCRFSRGVSDPLRQAQASKVSYRRGEGYTGGAWKTPHKLNIDSFPVFPGRAEFDHHYEKVIGIAPEVVRDISDHMVAVKSVITYGFLDSRDQTLGVLSIDFLESLFVKSQSLFDRETYVLDDTAFDGSTFVPHLYTLHNVLESLRITERRRL